MAGRIAAVAIALGVAGCDDGLTPRDDGDGALVLCEIDTQHFCDMVGVVDIVAQATAVRCAAGDRGCVVGEPLEGTVFTCPASDPTGLAAVEVRVPGEYRVAAVARRTAAEPLIECFATEAGADAFVVTAAQIEALAQIHAADGHAACPEN